ncbi:hypothetical protein [Streptomyces sp. NPDC101178]|uniref:hypothetical protein n=1 Tax=Streptomyces sp. NPDC101178 TaxID=3366124 RepID=UPI0037F6F672
MSGVKSKVAAVALAGASVVAFPSPAPAVTHWAQGAAADLNRAAPTGGHVQLNRVVTG